MAKNFPRFLSRFNEKVHFLVDEECAELAEPDFGIFKEVVFLVNLQNSHSQMKQ